MHDESTPPPIRDGYPREPWEQWNLTPYAPTADPHEVMTDLINDMHGTGDGLRACAHKVHGRHRRLTRCDIRAIPGSRYCTKHQ